MWKYSKQQLSPDKVCCLQFFRLKKVILQFFTDKLMELKPCPFTPILRYETQYCILKLTV